MEDELENFENVKYRIKNEGFHYCFKHYSNFEEINDNRFHELRKQYIEASNLLEGYVDEKIENLIEESFS